MRFIIQFLFVASLLCPTAGGLAEAAEKVDVLIVTGFDVASHKWEKSSKLNKTILEKSGRFDVSISTDKEVFASPTLNDYDVLVLNFGFWKEPDPSDAAKAGLIEYVQGGGNVVALHFACSAFQDWDAYGDMLGRVWVKGIGGHGPYGVFTVNIQDPDHPVTEGVEEFRTEDELYAKLSGDAKIHVLASAYSEWSGQTEPLVFTKTYGNGRVLQNLLGHGIRAKENPAYQQLLCRGVEWAATGKVTLE